MMKYDEALQETVSYKSVFKKGFLSLFWSSIEQIPGLERKCLSCHLLLVVFACNAKIFGTFFLIFLFACISKALQ